MGPRTYESLISRSSLYMSPLIRNVGILLCRRSHLADYFLAAATAYVIGEQGKITKETPHMPWINEYHSCRHHQGQVPAVRALRHRATTRTKFVCLFVRLVLPILEQHYYSLSLLNIYEVCCRLHR